MPRQTSALVARCATDRAPGNPRAPFPVLLGALSFARYSRATEGKNVGTRIGLLSAHLLWRHIARGAHDQSLFGVEEIVEREPYAPEVEYQGRKAYVLARKPEVLAQQ